MTETRVMETVKTLLNFCVQHQAKLTVVQVVIPCLLFVEDYLGQKFYEGDGTDFAFSVKDPFKKALKKGWEDDLFSSLKVTLLMGGSYVVTRISRHYECNAIVPAGVNLLAFCYLEKQLKSAKGETRNNVLRNLALINQALAVYKALNGL
ncbi:hypothetical protein IPH67_01150 [bacterium]|nr:MAG: hypothetical protein IPH67_01150 [bacterium]